MINVIAVITAKPGQRRAVLEAFRANRANVLAEDGCIEYDAAVDVDPVLGFQAPFGPDAFVVIEKWRDLDALKAHARAPHMAAYAAQTKDMVASRAVHVLSPAPSARDIDLDEVGRLVDALEEDLAKARNDSSRIDALRAEVEQLRSALGSGSPGGGDVHRGLSGLRDSMHKLGDELISDAFEGSRYIAQIGRILGM